MKRFVFIFLMLFVFVAGYSQTYFINTGTKPLVLAVAWKMESELFNGTVCKGWVTIAPGEKIKSPALGDIWFYRKGENTTSGKKVLVGVGDFTIRNADMDYVKDQNTSYQWVFCNYHQDGYDNPQKERIIDVWKLKAIPAKQ